MTWLRLIPWTWRRYSVAVAIIAVAAAARAAFLGGLGARIPYLLFYPAVMISALYGGLPAGVLATGLSTLWTIYWIQKGVLDSAEQLATGIFVFNCLMMSGVAEAMRRARARAKLAQKKAEAANLAKSAFLASMSHELRTPLNAILGFSQLMRNAASTSEEQRETLDIINRSGEHLLALINDVLDMAKIEAGGIAVEVAPVDLGEMVRDVADLMRERAGAKNLQLVLDQSSQFPRFVRADGAKLRQVLINLVGNAIKYTDHGSVTVRLNAGPAAAPDARLPLLVEVEDTGVGITAEDLARIFDPFVQVGTATQQTGTGLGLAITHKYVELMGGRISVESTPGRGSKFRVEVPVDPATISDLGATAIERGRVVGLAPGQPEYRILIVEDQVENWLLLQRLLEGAGFQVRVAENGAVGVELFQSWRPHFIWMDVRMPVMDGLEATRRIRALEGGRDVKIVALTASVFAEERGQVLAAGMVDFIRKPYRAEEVFDCLVRHLGVRFLYDGAPSASAEEPPAVLRPEAFASVPRELRGELADALVQLDVARVAELIRCVSDLDPALGDVLAHHAGRFGYSVILQAVKGTL